MAAPKRLPGSTSTSARIRAKEPCGNKRPCACCGTKFQPTVTRRALCRDCFKYGEIRKQPW